MVVAASCFTVGLLFFSSDGETQSFYAKAKVLTEEFKSKLIYF